MHIFENWIYWVSDDDFSYEDEVEESQIDLQCQWYCFIINDETNLDFDPLTDSFVNHTISTENAEEDVFNEGDVERFKNSELNVRIYAFLF